MTDYEVTQIGALDEWRGFYGGFTPAKSRDGRRVVDFELTMQFMGITANSYVAGEEAGYWHRHSRVEEVYLFLEGAGQMGLNDTVVDVTAGSVVRVAQGTWRTWRAVPDGPGMKWLCIRAGGYALPEVPDDSERDETRPSPW